MNATNLRTAVTASKSALEALAAGQSPKAVVETLNVALEAAGALPVGRMGNRDKYATRIGRTLESLEAAFTKAVELEAALQVETSAACPLAPADAPSKAARVKALLSGAAKPAPRMSKEPRLTTIVFEGGEEISGRRLSAAIRRLAPEARADVARSVGIDPVLHLSRISLARAVTVALFGRACPDAVRAELDAASARNEPKTARPARGSARVLTFAMCLLRDDGATYQEIAEALFVDYPERSGRFGAEPVGSASEYLSFARTAVNHFRHGRQFSIARDLVGHIEKIQRADGAAAYRVTEASAVAAIVEASS